MSSIPTVREADFGILSLTNLRTPSFLIVGKRSETGVIAEISGDEWQLEMLCNVAASELLMPTGTFPELANEEDLSIAHLMELRHKDHRFEWTRAEFQEWGSAVADHVGYSVRFAPIGPQDNEVGSPTQMGVFCYG